jgi:protein phosphatase
MPAAHILVDAGERDGLNCESGLFPPDFASQAFSNRLVSLQDAARRLPVGIITTLHEERASVIVDHNTRNAHRMLTGHLATPISRVSLASMSSYLAAGSSTGLVRKRNEDSAYAGRWLCAVADGMGGHVRGDVASAAVVAALRPFDTDIDSPKRLTTLLHRAVDAASERLAAMIGTDPGLAGMGTTLTAMLWSGKYVAIANIGDSRAYLLRGGALRQITEDHVMSKLVANPAPVQISAIIVRYLDGRPDRSPDLTLRTARPGDRYLICSDGLSGVLEPTVIRGALSAAKDADQAVADLIQLTIEAGAPDNVTVIVADVPQGAWSVPDGGVTVLGAAASGAIAR